MKFGREGLVRGECIPKDSSRTMLERARMRGARRIFLDSGPRLPPP